jgi:cytochrome c-type biogenesis protein CcmE
MSNVLASRRARLVMLLVIASAAITVLAFKAAGSSVSYYLTPAEYVAEPAYEGTRVRVAGRVVDGSVEEQAGRPVAFTIKGDAEDTITVAFTDGEVPNLFGPYALVVVEGIGGSGHVDADAVIIKHEDEFFSETPPADSISSHFVDPTATPGYGQ